MSNHANDPTFGGFTGDFPIRPAVHEGTVELQAKKGGLLVRVSTGLLLMSEYLVQWDQVDAWMEAARGHSYDAADLMTDLAFGKLEQFLESEDNRE